ncbi:MAG: hypothetical protein AVDCRST_MAG19-4465 [uncultured Thermomicrobiales bacterium]|uniref:Major facilitator superfamily (MFS) profile domain-containing protein n=1 Tax=uncultured Thermomicrobiales bacterium TaxID=1645740 RepID=A0A6J4VSL8_9BACT|nr:MAG: hypothetical protein AVDCRST_MAG19-4465 [uncultured Thermomicrobiales bacterium]
MRRVALRSLGAADGAAPAPSVPPAAGRHGLAPILGTITGADSAADASALVPARTSRLAPAARLVHLAQRGRTPGRPPLLRDERFRLFWLSRLAAQTGQGALLYAFLLVVADRTDSATSNSLFVVCSIIPSIAFGLPAGIVVDVLPGRPLLIGLNLVRFVFAFSLITIEVSLPGIFAATLGLWTIHQFYSPSESAALAGLVPRERFPAAQALSNLALTLAQLAGLVILAPLVLKTAGPRTLFAVCASLFVVAAGFVAMLPRLDGHLGTTAARRRSLRGTLLDGWHGARADHLTYRALVNDVLIGIGMSALIVIMPLYLKRVLNTAAENTVFVFAPAALGLVVGLRYAPGIGRALGEERIASAGLLGFALCVGSLGFVEGLRDLFVDTLRLPLNQIADLAGIPSLVVVAMLLSIPAGFCSALVSVTARALLLTHTPPGRRGQTIATTTLLGNVGALVPTLLAGLAADLFGVEPIAIAIAVAIVAGAVAARALARPLPTPAASPTG